MNEPSQLEDLASEANRHFVERCRERSEDITAFRGYLPRARKAGALSAKVKELINPAIPPATHSTPCVVRHTKTSLAQGATRDEILATPLAAIGMGDGLPHTQSVYMLDALETWGATLEEADAKAQT